VFLAMEITLALRNLKLCRVVYRLSLLFTVRVVVTTTALLQMMDNFTCGVEPTQVSLAWIKSTCKLMLLEKYVFSQFILPTFHNTTKRLNKYHLARLIRLLLTN
jgi:hypothetical protein